VRARFVQAEPGGLRCTLCPHDCLLQPGQPGLCGLRRNVGGELQTLADGRLAAAHAAPIERKCLYHVAPGSLAFSYGAPGCNLRCGYCQNWMVSQTPKSGDWTAPRRLSPAELVAAARAAGCRAVAATFTEPTVAIEYNLEVAQRARAAGLLVVWKTNGFIGTAAREAVTPHLDAVNVDLKTLDERLAAEALGGGVGPVLAALEAWRAAGVWVEVTTLVVPTLTDETAQLDAMAAWIGERLGPETPWHLNRFHPDFALRHLPPTPVEVLGVARARALAGGLRHVYTDAEARGAGRDTFCAACGTRLLERGESGLLADRRRGGVCPVCAARPAGLWPAMANAAAEVA
jgi:pyruvate formate lyase activating enzyme